MPRFFGDFFAVKKYAVVHVGRHLPQFLEIFCSQKICYTLGRKCPIFSEKLNSQSPCFHGL